MGEVRCEEAAAQAAAEQAVRAVVVPETAAVAVGVFLLCAFVGKPWRRWGQVAEDHPDSWYFETASKVYRPDLYLAAANKLVEAGSIPAAAVPETDGFRAPTTGFIDGMSYDGHKPNDYIAGYLAALGAMVALHVAAALWHHHVRRDDTLRRMLPWGLRRAPPPTVPPCDSRRRCAPRKPPPCGAWRSLPTRKWPR